MDDQVAPLLERIDARERELIGHAAQIRAQMDELAARLRELDEEIRLPRRSGSGGGRVVAGG
ncbi:hypothetical protein [Streptomyces sp. NPDC006463]|uniref:hypothetical protein n=1 Tax=Streptomyces sp. NPDC006463 TaxID=3364746 RepID=UPI003680AC27